MALEPKLIWQGNPISNEHQPDPSQIVDWAQDKDARVASLEGLNIQSRLDGLEGTVTAGQVAKAPVALLVDFNTNLTGEKTVDGTLTSASRVAVTAQTSATENGIYITSSGAWTRASDMDASSEVHLTTVLVQGGVAHGGESWKFQVSNPSTFVLGSDAIAAVKVGDAEALRSYLETGIEGKMDAAANLADVADLSLAAENLGVGDFADVRGVARSVDVRTKQIEASASGGNNVESALHPTLKGLESLAWAIADAGGNLALGMDDAGALLVSVMKVLGKLEAEAFEIDRGSSQYPWAIADSRGSIALALSNAGELLVTGGAKLGGASDWDFALIDAQGYVGLGIKDGALYMPGGAGENVASADARNKTWSAAMAHNPPKVQLPTATNNVLMNYGQSLGEGNETWPSLSKVPQPGALMIGDNVDNLAASSYEAMGVDQFNPLVANTHNGTANLTGAQEADLTPGATNWGEPPIIGLTNGLKFTLNRRALSENDGRNLVAMSSAQGGKTIEQLSKDNNQDAVNRYGGMLDGITLAKTLSEAETCVCPVVTWLQGEWDYRTDTGSNNATKALYKAALHALFDDMNVDIPAITGQALPPLKLLYQTGASYTRDVDANGAPGLHVGMAQLEVALERDDAVMVGPVYPYPDKGGHLQPNGSRWFGHQMAKVAAKVMAGEGWQPLRPLSVATAGRTITIGFHVPVPPLRLKAPYVFNTATNSNAMGFRLTSADGATGYAISSVEIVSDTVIQIVAGEDFPPDALIWYADKTVNNGNGMVCDSDPTLAIDTYEYVPERGMYAEANIPELVGQRYSLENWSVAFTLPLTYSEF